MATLKSSTTTQLTDVTECCICLKTFTDPRMLPCIHTFCFQCLQEMVDKSDKKPGDTILCPMCRKEFTIPSDGVQAIQKNVFLAGVIEVKDTLIESRVVVAPCDVCKANDAGTESNTSKATSRCLDCQENLCEDCSKMHKAFKMSRNHKVKKIDGEAGEEEVNKTFNLMNCDIHRGKVLDYYCAECKKVVCVSCFVEGHKTHNCKDVNTVEDKFRPVIKRIADKMSRLAGELLARKDKSESKEVLLTNIGEREQEILQRSDELKKMIDQHTKLLISTLDEIKDRRLKALQARDDELDRHILIEESLKRYCDELVSKGSAGDVCRNKDELLRRAGVIEEDHESYMMRPRVSCDVAFAPSDLNKFLQNTNGSMIGSLKDECVEAFAVMIAKVGYISSSHKINLHSKSDNASPIEEVPTTVEYVYLPAVAVYNNTMFITGIGKNLNEIWKYNFSSGWIRCGSLVQGRHGHCAEFINETLYISGGSNQSRGMPILTNHVEAYNAVTGKSIEVGQLKIGSDRSDCVAYKGSIYVFGGLDKDQKWLNCVQVFNPVETKCTLLSIPIPSSIAYMRALSWKDYAILLGRDTCYVLDFENMTWHERKQFKTDSAAHYFVTIVENERIFIIQSYSAISSFFYGGASQRQQRKDIEYIKASSIFNNEAPKWRLCGQLTQEFGIYAVPKLPLIN